MGNQPNTDLIDKLRNGIIGKPTKLKLITITIDPKFQINDYSHTIWSFNYVHYQNEHTHMIWDYNGEICLQ